MTAQCIQHASEIDAFLFLRLAPGSMPRTLASLGYSDTTVDRIAAALGAAPLRTVGHAGDRPAFNALSETTPATILTGAGEDVPELALVVTSDADVGVFLCPALTAMQRDSVRTRLVSVLSLVLSWDRDLGDTSRAYEFARATLSDVPVGLIAVDPDGRVIFLNAAGERVLGTSIGEAVGGASLEVFRTLVEGENVLLQGLGASLPPLEIWIRRHDGGEIPIELRLFPVRGSEGKLHGAVGAFQDLTSVRATQDQLRHRERLATIGELAAGIAHEIGNPLTGIRGCAQILRDRFSEDESATKLVSVILEEVDRLSRLSHQVRQFVRPNAPHMRKAAVAEILDRVVELSAARAAEKGVRFERRDGAIPDVYLDTDQIQQVLLNLAANAIDAFPETGGRVVLETRTVRLPLAPAARRGRRSSDRIGDASAREREFVRIAVSDDGRGMSEDELARAFHPFFTTKRDGLGLGLSISQTIIGEHAGFLSVASQSGKGTTFFVDLPVDRRAE